MKNINLKKGDLARVFDYGNDIFDKVVLIISNDTLSNEIIYKTNTEEEIVFSGQGYFEDELKTKLKTH